MQVSGGQWTRISGTAAGTAVVHERECVLERIIIPATKTGTVTFYDSDSLAGTALTNEIAVVVNDTVDFPHSIECQIQCKNGLTYLKGGTTDLTVVTR